MRALAVPCLAALLAPLACAGVDDIQVDAEGQAVIPAGTVVDQLLGDVAVLGFQDMDITQEQEFENQGYTRDQIDRARLSAFSLEVTAPAGQTFDWLESISFSATAEGLPTVEIAGLDPVPEGRTTLELEIRDVDLTPYVIAPAMTITTEASGSRPEVETTIAARIAIDVDVNVSGACSSGAGGGELGPDAGRQAGARPSGRR